MALAYAPTAAPAASRDPRDARKPNPVDVHVGGKVRARRRLLGLSQDQLADRLGLTFQQVQKYERGANRVCASKLFAIAGALAVPPAFFFEGLKDGPEALTDAAGVEDPFQTMAGAPGGLELARVWLDLSPRQQQALLAVALQIREAIRQAQG